MDYRKSYNEEYYRTSCGEIPYDNLDIWFQHFEEIADKIIRDINPRTVLDVGCAMGYLVAALRDRGVEAYGIDISEYAISKVREDIKTYCKATSALETLPPDYPEKYDLLITIEVIEHLYEEDGIEFLNVITKYSDDILFSSSPNDIIEVTHYNVQQPEYWCKKFAQLEFYHNIEYDASYISSQAVRFIKTPLLNVRIVENYEKYIRMLKLKLYDQYTYNLNEKLGLITQLNNTLVLKENQVNNLMLSSENKDLLLLDYKNKTDVLNTELENSKTELFLLKVENDKSLNLAKDFNEDVKKCNEELHKHKTEIEKYKQEIENYKTEKENTKKRIENYEKLTENNEKAIENYKIEIEKNIKEIILLESKDVILMENINSIKSELDEAYVIIDARDKEIIEYSKVVTYIDDLRKIADEEKNIFERLYTYINNSFSWKITKPLRILLKGLRFLLFRNILTRNLKMVLISIKHNGFKMTILKIKSRLQAKKINNTTVAATVISNSGDGVLSLINQRFRNLQPIPHIIVENKTTRLNLVTDSIDKNSLLGGVATALIIATEFARYCNIPLRIITRNASVNPANYKNIIKLSGLYPYNNVEFYSDYERDSEGNITFKLEVSENDIFFATSWWSASAIQKTSVRDRFFYIIQEVETFFYPHGEEHYLCTEIMESKNIDFIINSKYLYQYFGKNNLNIYNNGVYFNPAFSNGMYKPGKFENKNKYKLFFYARPNNPRNMFYYGIELIEYSISMGILNTDQWDIYCAGQNIPEIVFSNGYKAIDLGLMSWEEYGDFLSSIDLAVSLMYTPHPSYPPYDVACSGGVVVTNTCLNKIDFEESKNIILVSLEKDEFIVGIKNAIELAKDMPTRKKNFEESLIPRSWDGELNNVMEFMKEKL